MPMPDLDQIKQARRALAVFDGLVGQSRRPAARLPRPRQPRRPAVARRRRQGTDPQSRRAGDGDANTSREMKHPMYEHRGGCHCGNLALCLRLSQAPEDTPLRACGCSFSRAHNTRTASDAHGSVEIWAEDWSLVEPYRFGSGTAEFLICRRCGVYVGAVCVTTIGACAVINTNCLEDRATFIRQPAPVDHDGEATEDRLARRAANWTPANIHR
jgi:hypothetical protein